MSPADLKKMADYVKYLEQKGADEEKSADYVDAIATYLKLVDVLLVYADVVPTYPEWVKCTSSASNYQKKVKQLIAAASLKQKQEDEQALLQKQQPIAEKAPEIKAASPAGKP